MKSILDIKPTTGNRLLRGMAAVYGRNGKPRKARRGDKKIGIYIGKGKILFSEKAHCIGSLNNVYLTK